MNLKFWQNKSLTAEKPPDTLSLLISQVISQAFPNINPDDRSGLIKAGNGFAYAICDKIANSCAMVPLRLMTTKKISGLKTRSLDRITKTYLSSERSGLHLKVEVDEIQEVIDHPISVLLENMNSYDDGIDVMANTQLQLLYVGTSFWIADRGESQIIDPQAIHLLEPEKVTPIFDTKIYRKINGYKYSGQEKDLTPEEVIRFRYSNAGDWFWGKSPLSAAIEFYNTSGNLATLLKELSKNKTGMDLYVTNKSENSQVLQGEALKSVKEQFKDYRLGNVKADEIMYLGNMDLQAIPNMNRDLPYIENLIGLFRFMCWVFGISDSVFAKESSNRADKKEAIRDYFTSCIQPKLVRMQSRLTRYLIPRFRGAKEQGLFLVYEDCVPVDVELLIKELQAGGMTINEFREIRKRDAVDGGEITYVPSTMTPIGATMTPEEQGKTFAKAVKEEMEKGER
jgi:HK97 family phage portal protein